MRPLLEILEDERTLILKQDTIYQNMNRYPGAEAHDLLVTRKNIVDRDLEEIRKELREYIADLFKE